MCRPAARPCCSPGVFSLLPGVGDVIDVGVDQLRDPVEPALGRVPAVEDGGARVVLSAAAGAAAGAGHSWAELLCMAMACGCIFQQHVRKHGCRSVPEQWQPRRKGGDGQPQGEAVGSTHPPTAAARSSATTKARIAGPVHEGRTRGGRGVCSRWVSLNERTGREGVSQRAPSCLAAWMMPPPGAGQRNRPPVSRGKRERRGPVAMHAPEAPAACHSANGLESAHPS